MRVLYLTNNFPYPLTSGYLRHYFLIKELSRWHEVTLLSLAKPHFRDEHARALEPFAEAVMAFPAPAQPSRWHKGARRLLALVRPRPEVLKMRAVVGRLAAEKQYDVIVSGKYTFPAVEPLLRRGVPLVADMCDATSARIRRTAQYAPWLKRPFLALEYLHVRQIERQLMRVADHSIFISCRDREDVLGADTRARTTIVPNGVDLAYWQRSAPRLGYRTIVFTGAMGYRPNTDAALYLIQEILPAVERQIPDVRLLIVGKEPPPALRQAGQRPNVTVTGFVEDVRPYLEQATVFAAPLRFGAGMQNKVLEAMAMEVPVVASPLAADGLRTEEGHVPPLQVAADTDGFVDALVRTLQEREANPEPDREARRFVERHFVWEESGAKLDRVLRLVCQRARQPLASTAQGVAE